MKSRCLAARLVFDVCNNSTARPKDLREQMVRRVETASKEDLIFVYKLLFMAERERVWKEIQQESMAEADAGKLDNMAELVRQYRVRSKTQARLSV